MTEAMSKGFKTLPFDLLGCVLSELYRTGLYSRKNLNLKQVEFTVNIPTTWEQQLKSWLPEYFACQ